MSEVSLLEDRSRNPSTITFLCHLTGNVNISRLADTLPVVRIIDKETKSTLFYLCEGRKTNGEPTKPRITLGYFGNQHKDESFIVGVRFDKKSRGIRRGGKAFNNVTAIDLQCCHKNIHVKISKTKLTLTGILSEEMGHIASQKVCDLINMTQQNILYVQKSSPEVIQFHLENLYNYCLTEEGELDLPKNIIAKLKESEKESNCALDWKIINTFLVYITDNDIENFKDYMDKINMILKIDEIATLDINPGSYEICTKAYSHRLNVEKINLVKLVTFLCSEGFNVSFNNSNPTQLIIDIASKSVPNKLHHITINKKKTMRHNSPADEKETQEVFSNVMTYLEKFFYENNDFDYYIQKISEKK